MTKFEGRNGKGEMVIKQSKGVNIPEEQKGRGRNYKKESKYACSVFRE